MDFDFPYPRMVVFSAPSGAGKTTIVHEITRRFDCFAFSISATTRKPRPNEVDGVDYFFLSETEFRKRVDAGDFLEWEEVYPGRMYGTLKSEVDRIQALDKLAIFDVDVQGGIEIKNIFGAEALSFFIQPPSLKVLHDRLASRGTETSEDLQKRVAKAKSEMMFAMKFDFIVINDKLPVAIAEVSHVISMRTGQKPLSAPQ